MLTTNNIKNQSDNKRWNKWAWRALSWKDTDQCATGILRQLCRRFAFLDFSRTSRVTQSCNHKQLWAKLCFHNTNRLFSIPGVAIMTWEVKSGSHAGAKNLHMIVQKIGMSQLKSKCPSWIYMRNDTKLEYPRKNTFIKVGKEPNCIKYVKSKVGQSKKKTQRLITSYFALGNRLTWTKKVCKQAQWRMACVKASHA